MHMNKHNQDAPAKLKTCDGDHTLDSMLGYYLVDPLCQARGERNKPGEMDVILGRGQLVRIHPGNQRFRKIVRNHYDAYSNATSKPNKGLVVSRIIDMVRGMKGGDFVRLNPDTGSYDKVSERLAREKVGQTLRDVLHMKYSSSTKAKKRRKVAKREFIEEKVHTVVIDNVEVQDIMTNLMEHLKLIDDDHSDCIVESMFLEANMKILHELKQSNAAGALVVGVASTKPALVSSAGGKGSDSDSEMVFL